MSPHIENGEHVAVKGLTPREVALDEREMALARREAEFEARLARQSCAEETSYYDVEREQIVPLVSVSEACHSMVRSHCDSNRSTCSGSKTPRQVTPASDDLDNADNAMQAKTCCRRSPYALCSLAILIAVVIALLGVQFSGHLSETEDWVEDTIFRPPVTSWQMVAPGHHVHVMESMSLGKPRTLAVKRDILCELFSGRQKGAWLELADEPGYVQIKEGDLEVLMPTLDGSPVGICRDNSTTNTTTTTTVTGTSVPGGWLVAKLERSCTEACSSIGTHCQERSLQKHNRDASDYASVKVLADQMGTACLAFDDNNGSNVDVPCIDTSSHWCAISDAHRDSDTFSCGAMPGEGKQRLCYCEDWLEVQREHRGEPPLDYETWQVVHYGQNEVFSLKDASSQRRGHQKPCSLLEGRKEGSWLRLKGGRGFLPVDAGSEPRVERAFDGSSRAAACQDNTTTSSTTTMTTTTAWPSLYCVLAVRPGGYELPLVQAQATTPAGIFLCNTYNVYSSKRLAIGNGEFTHVFKSAPVGVSKDGFAANVQLFINFWERVRIDGHYMTHDWTVKADPDAVVFPDRIRDHVRPMSAYPCGPHFWANCDKYGDHLYGSVEVFSNAAMHLFYEPDVVDKCKANCDWEHLGEDNFMETCMRSIGVQSEKDNRLVGDERCFGTSHCQDITLASFHPFKDIHGWFECYNTSMQKSLTLSLY